MAFAGGAAQNQSMLHALTAPLGKTIAVGGLAVLALAVAGRPHEQAHGRRLVLHAEARPTATYLTVFKHGEIHMPADAGGRLTTIVFKNSGDVGARCTTTEQAPACHWIGTERLEPIDEHTYAYSYTEELLGCDDGAAQNCIDTPRTGYVTVER
jgi:hypothetical protein